VGRLPVKRIEQEKKITSHERNALWQNMKKKKVGKLAKWVILLFYNY
jgi:hypothetical protein